MNDLDDLTYIIKICIQAVNVLLACEMGVFLISKRKGQSKGLKKSLFQPKLTIHIYWGFIFLFFFSTIAFIFAGLETRWEYFLPESSTLVEGPIRIFDSLKELSFYYASSSIFLMVSPILSKKRLWLPLIMILIVWPIIFVAVEHYFYAIGYIIPFGVVTFFFIRIFVRMTESKLREQFLCIFVGYVIYFVGYLLMITFFEGPLSFENSIFPEIVMLGALVFMGAGFIPMPSLNEAFSTAFIDQIFLAAKDGKIILRHNFRATGENNSSETDLKAGVIDDTTFTSSIVGIEGLLREISATKGRVKALDEGDKIFLIDRITSGAEQASNIFAILVTYLDLHVLRAQLLNLVYDVETNFLGEILANEKVSDGTRTKIIEAIEKRFNVPLRSQKSTLKSSLLNAAIPH